MSKKENPILLPSSTKHKAGGSSRHRRATVLLEFMLILPLFLFLVFFSVDMGRLMVVYGAVGDATYVAARAGAQYGTTNVNGVPVADEAYQRSLDGMPGVSGSTSKLVVISGECTSKSSYIVTEGQQTVSLITPGLGALLKSFEGGDSGYGADWVLKARASVLCEVVR